MNDLVIVGAGGHGREVLDVVRAINAQRPTWQILGFVDDAPEHLDRVDRLDTRVLGDLSAARGLGGHFVLGIGTSEVRERLAERLAADGLEPASVVHPEALVGSDVRLAPGVVIFSRCTVTTNVSIGAHTHLNVGCAVQHDSVIGDFVQFSPGVMVNGDCTVHDGVFLGTGAIVTRGVTVGRGARVGAGAVVLEDVSPGLTVVGAPAAPTASNR